MLSGSISPVFVQLILMTDKYDINIIIYGRQSEGETVWSHVSISIVSMYGALMAPSAADFILNI